MSTTLYTVAPVTKFSAQGYDIVQAGTVVPDGVVWAIQTAAFGAGVTINTSAGGTPQLVQVPSYYNGGTGSPVGDSLPVGAEVKDSTGAVFEKTPGGWVAATGGTQSGARLASLYSRLAAPAGNPFATTTPAADTPTVTTSGAATVATAQLIGVQSGLVTELGSRGSYNNTFNRWDVSGKGGPAGLDFYLTGTTIEFCFVPTGSGAPLPVWIWVNGLPVTATPDVTTISNVASAGTDIFYKLVFPSSAQRRVEIFVGGGAGFNAWRPIRTDFNTLVTPAPRKPVVAFVGDSFFAGSAAGYELQYSAFVMSRLLGVECVDLSYGGTGYVAAGSFTVFGSSTRTTLAAAANPDLLIFSGSLNDDGSAGIQTAATAAFAAFATACPKAKALVFGPQPSSATATVAANRATTNAAVAAAAAAATNVLGYVDMVGTVSGSVPAAWAGATTYSDGTLVTYKGSVWKASANGGTFSGDTPGSSPRWVPLTYVMTGTGNSGGATGDGTRDTYLYSDSVHPTVAGSTALAIRQANQVRAALAAVVTA